MILARRKFLQICAAATVFRRYPLLAQQADWQKNFFVMDTWFWQAPPEFDIGAQVALVKKLGYGGMALSWGQKHAERLQALREQGLAIPGCYITVDIDAGYPSHLSDCVKLLRGTGASVWLALTSKKFGRSDQAADSAAGAIVKRCLDECTEREVPGVVLYPHAGFWMERVSDAVRLCAKANHPEVGLQFNQYHWMVADRGENLQATLGEANKYLKGVSINGSARRSPSILPLGEGDYDVLPILRRLFELRYKGPVSHQGYSIKGNIPTRLAAAKQAWDALRAQAS